MNERKNILIGKIGKSVKMKNIHIETGGGADLVLYSTMARMCPEYHFYFIGPNELYKCTDAEYEKLFPNKNVHSAWSPDIRKTMNFQLIVDYFKDNNIKVDFALLFNGLSGNTNIRGFLTKPDGNFYSPLMCFQNYAGPIIYTLNELMCPLYMMAEDARYITINSKDLYNRERLIFSQINGDFETTLGHVVSKTDWTIVKTTHHAKYSHLEKIFLMGLSDDWKEKIDFEAKRNSTVEPVIVLSNGCGTAKINCAGNNSSRLPAYKKYIIDNFKGTKYENTKIYGSVWDKNVYEQYPQIQDKLMLDLGKEVSEAKYTLVYSQVPGFVTCKPWEMITIGLLPFLHPDYDCYHLLDLPEYLYCKDEKDFLNKIDELENDFDKYKDLMQQCFDLIKPEYLNGWLIVNGIFGNIAKDLGFKYSFKPGVKSIFNRFSKEFIQ